MLVESNIFSLISSLQEPALPFMHSATVCYEWFNWITRQTIVSLWATLCMWAALMSTNSLITSNMTSSSISLFLYLPTQRWGEKCKKYLETSDFSSILEVVIVVSGWPCFMTLLSGSTLSASEHLSSVSLSGLNLHLDINRLKWLLKREDSWPRNE